VTHRERVLQALSFEETDRPPMDLGSTLCTGISCFAYPGLVGALNLPPRRPRVHDTAQMLALPDLDVLDALGCDVVTVAQFYNRTNGFEQPDKWHPYDFNGRLDALVARPERFELLEDGTIVQPRFGTKMPPGAYVFDAEHGGQPVSLSADIPKPDLAELRKRLENGLLTPNRIETCTDMCRRVRESTDRAVMLHGPTAGISIMGFGGVGIFPMLCLTDRDFVAELHELVIGYSIEQLERLLPAIHRYIDVYFCCADDWGSQQHTLASPQTYEDLFLPYYRRYNDAIHEIAPQLKTFLHTCGAVYDLIDPIIESGFDILNPVQWTAGGHGFREWKDKCRNRISLWGGGVNSQGALVHGSVEDVEAEVREIVDYLQTDGGFVFNGIHNLLAEVSPEKIQAMYRTAAVSA
jgi:uroporphyrinogen decarboxylase